MKSHPIRMKLHPNAGEIKPQGGTCFRERIAEFLRRKHPTKTADHVSAETGIPINTVKTWLKCGSAPDGEYCTTLWITYGPDFLAVLAGGRTPEWVKQLRRSHEALRLKTDIAALEQKLSKVLP